MLRFSNTTGRKWPNPAFLAQLWGFFFNLILLICIFSSFPRIFSGNPSMADTDASVIDTFSSISTSSNGHYNKKSHSDYWFKSLVNTVMFLIPSALSLSISPHTMDARSAYVSKLKNARKSSSQYEHHNYTKNLKTTQKKNISSELSSSPVTKLALPRCLPHSPFLYKAKCRTSHTCTFLIPIFLTGFYSCDSL